MIDSPLPLPDEDHVLRYCRPATVDKNGLPLPKAFSPRKDEKYLSVNWLECLKEPNDQDLSATIDRVRKNFAEKGILKLKKKGLMVQLNVGSVKNQIRGQVRLTITHQPTGEDKSHSGIFGYGDVNKTV